MHQHRRIFTLMALVAIMVSAMASAAFAKSSNPGGNNGTIKIEDNVLEPGTGGGHDNDPHVQCTFAVRGFGQDYGPQHIKLVFEAQPPSGHGQVLVATNPATMPMSFGFFGHGAGNTLDFQQVYQLDVSGLKQQPNQGYHVKLTTHTTGSHGSDVKHKVFWIQGCSPPTTTTQPPTTTTIPVTTTTKPPVTTTTTYIEHPTTTTQPGTPTTHKPKPPATKPPVTPTSPPPSQSLPRTGIPAGAVALFASTLFAIGALLVRKFGLHAGLPT